VSLFACGGEYGFDDLMIANSASQAFAPAAIRRGFFPPGAVGLLSEERLVKAAIDPFPGEGFSILTGSQIGGGVDTCVCEGLFPKVETKLVTPSVETAS
jgi:hypothetical protein